MKTFLIIILVIYSACYINNAIKYLPNDEGVKKAIEAMQLPVVHKELAEKNPKLVKGSIILGHIMSLVIIFVLIMVIIGL